MVCLTRVGHITKFALGTLTKYEDVMTDNRGDLKVKGQGHKLTSSVRLIITPT